VTPSSVSCHAVASPAMPPPTMATDTRSGSAVDGPRECSGLDGKSVSDVWSATPGG
jgi:hypothetical protein